ncbi:hypothetical protein EDD18DRAFT_771520 [Armillaria luteobubalina]|uniref:Uncharacterized protein n=1 Tax=Armillaria luteobubalina TaxID=153913 RepID=A0AA39V0H2_9AGAR|nr:hypothetical protein EDD18DRAFT_771520 [Armillaria luteobubalina]
MRAVERCYLFFLTATVKMSIYSSSSMPPHARSAGQTYSIPSPRHGRAQRPGSNTPSTPGSIYPESLLFSVNSQDIPTESPRAGSLNINRKLYSRSRNSARDAVHTYSSRVPTSLSPYSITRGPPDSSSSGSFFGTLNSSQGSHFRFPQSGIKASEGRPQRKHRPSPLNLMPQNSSARVSYNSGYRGPPPVQNAYVGTPAQYTGSSRRSHRPASVSQTHDSVDETPETPRTRANIQRNVAPLFAMINSRAAAMGVTATLDGDRLIFHNK